ncbi:N-(5'-phosphoribosyl)anthranilate isomerase [Vulcanimicrobium alpinum]|uniref:N-(5'-phosphoribosyl)anthranilate isomerase n=1 Tax=Vulcanimicrobium alpinum TaxID=3016050 RepID=A0AAN1XYU4_UNVUL|nr:phosphoribosylanthranilate isomerase [Vulcanimicrobium alpinum]BDE06727.1 N-(5'-phosphoribosyl)anthranilate isomerase [Vulcanimicrobium alpinum]
MRRTRVKICGVVSAEEAALVVDAGADAVGVILAPSPRRVGIERLHEIAERIPALVTLVAVFVDPPSALVDEALKVGAIPQFHGREPAEACEAFAAGPYVKAYHVGASEPVEHEAFERFARPYAHATWLFDTARPDGLSGGSGRTFSWNDARTLAGDRPFVVSGGLTPENVVDCVRAVRPFAVDVRSGVERNGVKDARLVRAFVDAVRAADAEAGP